MLQTTMTSQTQALARALVRVELAAAASIVVLPPGPAPLAF